MSAQKADHHHLLLNEDDSDTASLRLAEAEFKKIQEEFNRSFKISSSSSSSRKKSSDIAGKFKITSEDFEKFFD